MSYCVVAGTPSDCHAQRKTQTLARRGFAGEWALTSGGSPCCVILQGHATIYSASNKVFVICQTLKDRLLGIPL